MQNRLFLDEEVQPSFKCPHCKEHCSHQWKTVYDNNGPYMGITLSEAFELEDSNETIEESLSTIVKTKCNQCFKEALWVILSNSNEVQIYPFNTSNFPEPHSDMPTDIVRTFNEAGLVLPFSPGASAALARLTLENLLIHLGFTEGTLNDKVGEFISVKNPSEDVRKALDVVRVFGNSGAHSGIINLEEKPEVPVILLKLINIIVQNTISTTNEINELYDLIPSGVKKQINRRDNK